MNAYSRKDPISKRYNFEFFSISNFPAFSLQMEFHHLSQLIFILVPTTWKSVKPD